MALQRLKDQGGFNGDRIESCAMPTVFASGSDWLRTVVEKSDLAEGNLAGTRIRETTFAHTALRKARLRAARLERVELYFCDLNEIDWESERHSPVAQFDSVASDPPERIARIRRSACEQGLFYRDQRDRFLET